MGLFSEARGLNIEMLKEGGLGKVLWLVRYHVTCVLANGDYRDILITTTDRDTGVRY